MRRRGSRLRNTGYKELTASSVFNTEKTLDLNAKFGITNGSAIRFSRDYAYMFLFTQSSETPHYVLNVVDEKDINTWTLNETWGSLDYRGGHINNNGTKAYAGLSSLTQFDLSTPYLMSSRTQIATLTVGGTGFIGGVTMNPSETKLFVMKYSTGGFVREFDLVTPGNISGATFVREVAFSPTSNNERGIVFVNKGKAILSNSTGVLNIRTVSTPYTLDNLSAAIGLSGSFSAGYNAEINPMQNLIYTLVIGTLYQNKLA